MSESTISRAECENRTQNIHDLSLQLHLDLHRAAEGDDFFPVHATWKFSSEASSTHLDYLGKLSELWINGQRQDPHAAHSEGRIHLEDLRVGQVNEIEIQGLSRYSRTGQGLHRFHDGDDTYLYSHCEPSDARRIFPCFEQPDLKARVSLSISAPTTWRVFANANPLRQEDLDRGRRRTYFDSTPPLSSYLTAFAAGPYVGEQTTWHDQRSGNTIEVGVWCRHSMREHLDAEDFLTLTTGGLSWFCDLFDSAYPWQRYDSILVPEYNIGAMENPGLVTFTEKFIFRDDPTDAERAARANTVLHEMSHMWFGDYVTPQWWDDLWLKESFAEYMGSAASCATTQHTDAWVNFAGIRTAWAIEQDELSTTHPIAADIPDVDAARQNFDGITYAKGAAVLRQLVHFVGDDVFQEATRNYFRDHAYGTATFADFIHHLSEASGKDLGQWVYLWLQTTGVDQLTTTCEGSSVVIHNHGTPPRTHRLDLSVFHNYKGILQPLHRVDVELNGSETRIDTGLDSEQLEQSLLVVNDQAYSYCLAQPRAQDLALLDQSLSTIEDDLTRTVLWQQLWNLVRQGLLAPRHYVNMVSVHAWAERNATTLSTIVDNTRIAVEKYLAGEHQDKARRILARNLRDLLSEAVPGSDSQRIFLTGYISALGAVDAEDSPARLRALLDPAVLPDLARGPKLRWDIVCALRSLGVFGEAELAEEVQRDNTLNGKVRHLQATYCEPGRRKELLSRLTEPGELSNDELRAGLAAWNMPGAAAAEERTRVLGVENYLNHVSTWWETHPMEMANFIVRGLYPAEDQDGVAKVDQWLKTHPDIPRALQRALVESTDRARRAVMIQHAYPEGE
ncbi:aminopeptidase N [Corynebacterium sp. 3HC-13]|uniref:aminopeptidase N n=1 Tax=Corynebacterium poyangense TaxID=2684405 RepID=UPI001CCDE30C|nr:aminopeptidase N [Corynebacterium poyangense]MBZ8177888.1 aminopeptidase N [Corynebacterium poyangense]